MTELTALIARWQAEAAAYDATADELSRRGNLYAATRLEGKADAVRLCAAELETYIDMLPTAARGRESLE